MGKPRMTRADAWKKRPCVTKYWAFKHELVLLTKNIDIAPDDILGVAFVIQMPKSWSKKKKAEYDGQPHKQKPDLDNLIKSVMDCLFKEDSHIWKFSPSPYKIWGTKGQIILL